MKTNYVLVDFENVQPDSVAELAAAHFRLVVFIGANQSRIPVKLAATIQRLGERAKYVQMSGHGKNALDFHIAFYIGSLSERDPDAFFHVVSKDEGFDPLVVHLKTLDIFSARWSAIGDIPLVKSNGIRSPEERAALFIEKLQKGATRPRVLKTLKSAIATLFAKQLSEGEIDAVVAALQKSSFLSFDNNKVVYAASAV